jgi:hypothetical protein
VVDTVDRVKTLQRGKMAAKRWSGRGLLGKTGQKGRKKRYKDEKTGFTGDETG